MSGEEHREDELEGAVAPMQKMADFAVMMIGSVIVDLPGK